MSNAGSEGVVVRGWRRPWTVVGVASILAAVAVAAVAPVPAELVGTTWRWVHFASPAEGFAVVEPERYTLAFETSGRIVLRADCNRGVGDVAFPEPGAIRVGAVALTRAMCPPGSLGERFARDVSRAVRWSLRDSELRLELPVGSGTLSLTRQP